MKASDFSNTPKHASYDAIVVGSGPNGLAAAIKIAQSGASVLVIEAKDSPGGGMRTKELTLPGFEHDVCSAIHPMAIASPFFKTLPLAEHGLVWSQPDFPVVQPMANGEAVVHEREVERTAARLGKDRQAYIDLFEPFVKQADQLYEALLGPPTFPPKNLRATMAFGMHALKSAKSLAEAKFQTPEARALFAGHAAHSVQPLDSTATAAFGIMLGVSAHKVGWPVARGGSDNITRALVSIFRDLGGEVVCRRRIDTIEELPRSQAYLFDVAPVALARICRTRLPQAYVDSLKKYRHGPGVFKVDWALSEPIPWTNPGLRAHRLRSRRRNVGRGRRSGATGLARSSSAEAVPYFGSTDFI